MIFCMVIVITVASASVRKMPGARARTTSQGWSAGPACRSCPSSMRRSVQAALQCEHAGTRCHGGGRPPRAVRSGRALGPRGVAGRVAGRRGARRAGRSGGGRRRPGRGGTPGLRPAARPPPAHLRPARAPERRQRNGEAGASRGAGRRRRDRRAHQPRQGARRHRRRGRGDAGAGGAGVIGGYEHCSWAVEGQGTFFGREGAEPTLGRAGRDETVSELRLEVVFPRRLKRRVTGAYVAAHPYEEPAYDLYPVENEVATLGLGRLGVLPAAQPLAAFAADVAAVLRLPSLRYAGDGACHHLYTDGGSRGNPGPARSAWYSATLLVAVPIESASSSTTSPEAVSRMAPIPAGPGFPREPPSVYR